MLLYFFFSCYTSYPLPKSTYLTNFRDLPTYKYDTVSILFFIVKFSGMQKYQTRDLTIIPRKFLYQKGNTVFILSNQFPWNMNNSTALYVTLCFYHLAQLINWNWCYNMTWENKILFIRNLLGNTTVPEYKNLLANELNKLLKIWNSVGVKKKMVSHKIHSNSSKSGRIPAVKFAYSDIDFQELSE